MFEKIFSGNCDQIEKHVHALAADARICLRTWWKRMWRLHVAVARQSIQRVLALGSVQKAMQDTSLVFFMRAYSSQLQNILENAPITPQHHYTTVRQKH